MAEEPIAVRRARLTLAYRQSLLDRANALLGRQALAPEDWEAVKYAYDMAALDLEEALEKPLVLNPWTTY